MKAIFRPDTLYFWTHAKFKAEIAEAINTARAKAIGPKGLTIQGRIDRVMSEVDPFQAEAMLKMTFAELMNEIRSYEAANDEFHGEDDELVPEYVCISGIDFLITPFSLRRGCVATLTCAQGTLHVRVADPKKNSPNCYLEIGSVALWSCGNWQDFLDQWQAFLDTITREECEWHCSRVDLAFHCQGFTPEDLDRNNFVCRAENDKRYSQRAILAELTQAHAADTNSRNAGCLENADNVERLIEKWSKDTGFWWVEWHKNGVKQMIGFGTRNQIYCRIYNKSREIQRSPVKRALFGEVWHVVGFDADKDVYNVEFELGRKWLINREFSTYEGSDEFQTKGRRFKIDTVSDLIEHFDKLTTYLLGNGGTTEGWLRMIKPKSATRRSRCANNPIWDVIREAGQILPELHSREVARAQLVQTAPQVMRGAIGIVARLDAFCGRKRDLRTISKEDMMEAMAEAVFLGLARPEQTWSIENLQITYLAEHSKLVKFDPLTLLAS